MMSDGPTIVKNETLWLVSRGLHVSHHFIVPYSPWNNGRIERLGREIPHKFRWFTYELHLFHGEWPDNFHLVQSEINNEPSPQRSGLVPIKAMTELPPSPPPSPFYRGHKYAPVAVWDASRETALNVQEPSNLAGNFHVVVENAFQDNLLRNCASRSGEVPSSPMKR